MFGVQRVEHKIAMCPSGASSSALTTPETTGISSGSSESTRISSGRTLATSSGPRTMRSVPKLVPSVSGWYRTPAKTSSDVVSGRRPATSATCVSWIGESGRNRKSSRK